MKKHNDYWSVIFNTDDITLYEPYEDLRWHDLDSCLREVRARVSADMWQSHIKVYKVGFRLTQFCSDTHAVINYWDGWITNEGVLLDIV